MVTIVDYGMGNLGSIANMLEAVGSNSIITSDIALIESATKLILPGVGSYDAGMNNIKRRNLIPILNQKVLEEKIPILGICLGMQLMTKSSEEGSCDGLGWVNGSAHKFKDSLGKSLKVPHMGWNTVTASKNSSLFNGSTESRFYFVHSYYIKLRDQTEQLLSTNYGLKFTSGFEKDNIYGVQFHPEKSHEYGKAMFQSFVKL